MTAVMEKLSQGCLMAELDADVPRFGRQSWTVPRKSSIEGFEPTRDNVEQLEHETPQSCPAFRTLVLTPRGEW